MHRIIIQGGIWKLIYVRKMVLYIKGLKGLGARRSFPVENFVEYRISPGPDAPPVLYTWFTCVKTCKTCYSTLRWLTEMTGFGYLPMESFILVNTFSFIVKRIKNLVKTVQAFSLYLGAKFYFFFNKFLVIIYFFSYDLFGNLIFIYLFIYFLFHLDFQCIKTTWLALPYNITSLLYTGRAVGRFSSQILK